MSTLQRIMETVAPKKTQSKRKQAKMKRKKLVELFSQMFTLELNCSNPRSVQFNSLVNICEIRSWRFLKTERDVPADLRTYCDWCPTWERRAGKWRFFPPCQLLRSKNELQYLIASVVWRDALTRDPKDHNGEIFYDPETQSFLVYEWGDQRRFKSLEKVLRYVHANNQLEIRRAWAASRIQKAWRLVHGYAYVPYDEKGYLESSDSD